MRATTSTNKFRAAGLTLGLVLLAGTSAYAQPITARFTEGPLAHGNQGGSPVGPLAHGNNADGPVNPYGEYVPLGFPPPSPVVSPSGDGAEPDDGPLLWDRVAPFASDLGGAVVMPIAMPQSDGWLGLDDPFDPYILTRLRDPFALRLWPGEVAPIDVDGLGYEFTVPIGVNPTPIPEPATIMPATIMLAAIGWLVIRPRRRR